MSNSEIDYSKLVAEDDVPTLLDKAGYALHRIWTLKQAGSGHSYDSPEALKLVDKLLHWGQLMDAAVTLAERKQGLAVAPRGLKQSLRLAKAAERAGLHELATRDHHNVTAQLEALVGEPV